MGEALCDALVKFKEVQENRSMYNNNISTLSNQNHQGKGRSNDSNNEGKNKEQMIQKL